MPPAQTLSLYLAVFLVSFFASSISLEVNVCIAGDMAKILLAEDDYGLGETIVDWLEGENYFVDWKNNGVDALEHLKAFEYDAVILDWEMPQMTGIEVCTQYRSRGGQTPILFLTSRSAIEDKLAGFDVGADDYLPKPFAMKELSARIRALLKRPKAMVENVLRAGDMELHPKTHEFYRAGEKIKLSPIEFALMEFFLKNQNVVFNNDAILDRVWPATSERSPDTLRTCMRRLRNKIFKDDEDSAIRTVHGVGYKFELGSDK